MEGHAVISHEVLASYAADAALDIDGVRELVEGPRRHRGVRVSDDAEAVTVEVHVALEWGARAPEIGSAVQARVSEYVMRTTKLPAVVVDVVVDHVATGAAG